MREVLELGGGKNAFGKQLGSDNPLNNARAAVDGLMQLRTIQMAARNRDLTVEQMLNYKGGLHASHHLVPLLSPIFLVIFVALAVQASQEARSSNLRRGADGREHV